MTRATSKPVRRVVATTDGEMVVEITDRCLMLRPLRTRTGGSSEVVVSWGAIYLRAMLARVDEQQRVKRRTKLKARSVRSSKQVRASPAGPELLEKAKALAKAGKSLQEIAGALGLKYSRVWSWSKHADWPKS